LKALFGRYPKGFHFDGGKEINACLQAWLQHKGIEFSTSSPYIHEQNGLIERSIRVILDRLRATMLAAGLPLYLWCFTIPAVLELINSTALTNRDLTAYQELHDGLEPSKTHKPLLKRYKVIGARCEVFLPEEKRSKGYKLAPRTETGYLLAVLGNNTYQVYIPKRHTVLKTSIVKIYEDLSSIDTSLDTSGGFGPEGVEEGLLDPLERDIDPTTAGREPTLGLPKPSEPLSGPLEATGPLSGPTVPAGSILDPPEEPLSGLPALSAEGDPPEGSGELEDIGPTVGPTKSSPEGLGPTLPEEMDLSYAKQIVYSIFEKTRQKAYSTTSAQAPQTWKQVLKSPNKAKWLQAIYSEFKQIILQNTLEFWPDSKLPEGRKPITSRLVLKEKKDENNRVFKCKARLVVRGFQQREGVDYTDTFASTSTPPTWRVLLALAAILDWEIEQIDFIGAFLNGTLKEQVFMALLEGFKEFAAQASSLI
jgi:hypothetical protein